MIVRKEDILTYPLFLADSLPSTNTYLKENGKDYPDRSILFTLRQTEGRGRMEHVWKSEDDLCFSVLLKERERSEILVPVSLLRLFRKLRIKAFIKWPNDIYVQDRKLVGILVEDSYLGSDFLYSVIGIGINMKPKKEYKSTGVLDYLRITRLDLLTRFIQEYDEVRKTEFNLIMKEYQDNNLIYNRHIVFHGKTYQVKGFTPEGYLLAQDDQGTSLLIRSDEIDIKKSLL